jgi:hypothetical protein
MEPMDVDVLDPVTSMLDALADPRVPLTAQHLALLQGVVFAAASQAEDADLHEQLVVYAAAEMESARSPREKLDALQKLTTFVARWLKDNPYHPGRGYTVTGLPRAPNKNRVLIDQYSDLHGKYDEFAKFVGLRVDEFDDLLASVGPAIAAHCTPRRVSVENRLMLVIRRIKTKKTLEEIAADFGSNKTTVGYIMNEVVPLLFVDPFLKSHVVWPSAARIDHEVALVADWRVRCFHTGVCRPASHMYAVLCAAQSDGGFRHRRWQEERNRARWQNDGPSAPQDQLPE